MNGDCRWRQTISATAGAWRWCRFWICRLLFSRFGHSLGGGCRGFPVGFSAGVSRLLPRTFNCFFCLSCDGLSRRFGLLAYGLGSLFCFLPDRFGSLFCFLTYGFKSILNCFPCFLRTVLCVLKYALFTERSQRGGHD